MNLRIGIVGLPNAGKSTLFNALLKKQVADVAAYPFCTIEPNVGVVPVPDSRLPSLAEVTKVEEKMDKLPPVVPAIVEFVDIAGLVKGASQGEGLGNKFLSHIRETDIICHVVRYFEDSTVVNLAGDVNPLRDRDIIETELILADLQTLEKQQEPRGKVDRDTQKKWELIVLLRETLNTGKNARDMITDIDDRALINDLHLLSMKPVLFVLNVSEAQVTAEEDIVKQLGNAIVICAKTESELASLSLEEQRDYLASLGLTASGLDRLIQKTYDMLGLISFLTTGVLEARAWTIIRGTKAPQAAGVIHTDFEKKFIKADCVTFADFIAASGWKGAKEQGKVRQEGREYIMQDGDVVEFKIGA
ncbi:MAG: redox-regulated ATPase YchF [Candidatus Gottesmanbacteria bacterium]